MLIDPELSLKSLIEQERRVKQKKFDLETSGFCWLIKELRVAEVGTLSIKHAEMLVLIPGKAGLPSFTIKPVGESFKVYGSDKKFTRQQILQEIVRRVEIKL